MKFIDFQHQKDFFRLCREFEEIEKNDKERMVVLYLMAGNDDLEKKVKPYFNDDLFDFTEMFQEQDFSSGIKVLAELAVVLYNSGTNCNVSDFSYLSSRNLELALNAIEYRYKEENNGYYTPKEDIWIIKEPGIQDRYVSQQDISDMLNQAGIPGDRRKVSVYFKRGLLPEPDIYVGTTPGWKEEVIQEWVRQYQENKVVPRRNR